jgi:hypothetical protein
MAKAVAWTHSFAAPITSSQQSLALYFQEMLLWAASRAGTQLGALDVDSGGAHGMKMEERFLMDNPKPHRFFRASVGSTVERKVYTELKNLVLTDITPIVASGDWAGVYQANLATQSDLVRITFAIEYPPACPPALPSVFRSSRPDIRLALGQGSDGTYYEALYDLTSEGQIGHVLTKGDNWVAKHSVAYIAEIVWMNDDIMQK